MLNRGACALFTGYFRNNPNCTSDQVTFKAAVLAGPVPSTSCAACPGCCLLVSPVFCSVFPSSSYMLPKLTAAYMPWGTCRAVFSQLLALRDSLPIAHASCSSAPAGHRGPVSMWESAACLLRCAAPRKSTPSWSSSPRACAHAAAPAPARVCALSRCCSGRCCANAVDFTASGCSCDPAITEQADAAQVSCGTKPQGPPLHKNPPNRPRSQSLHALLRAASLLPGISSLPAAKCSGCQHVSAFT